MTDEQRSEPGCPVGRMQADLCKETLEKGLSATVQVLEPLQTEILLTLPLADVLVRAPDLCGQVRQDPLLQDP